jgi:hypothetical protein
MWDRLIARQLKTNRNLFMTLAGFEPTIPVFVWTKMCNTLERSVIVIGMELVKANN